MVDAPNIALAFAAGFVSFVSPCCLPLVPGYLAAISGGRPPEAGAPIDRALLLRSLVFVGSFSTVFILLGLTATAIGDFLFVNQPTLNKIAGIAIIAMGVLFIGSVFFLRLNREWRPHGLAERAAAGGPVLAGIAFAFAWTPCVGPTLGAILGLAAVESSTATGAALLAVYSAGLAIPFVFSAVAFNAAQRSFAFFKRHYAAIQIGAGAMLIAMGVLVLSGELTRLNIEVQRVLDDLDLNFFKSV